MEVLTELESEVIDVNIEAEEESFLVGRLVTEDKTWNPSHLIQAMKKVWNPTHVMSAAVWGEELILFRFDDSIDRDWILKHQPWNYQGYLFAIKKFTDRMEQQPSSSADFSIDYASFWIRLYDVPVSCLNESSLRLFVKHIGGLLESVDKADEDSVGKFVRIKVDINITKPLVRGITIRVKGEVMWLPLEYESLPIYCFCCGTIGHHHKNCGSSDQNVIKYGSWIKASRFETRKSQSGTFSTDKTTTLPHDIIENILSRLPVKYLHRFKAVSKQWKKTILDPQFAEIYLQRSKNSCLLAWDSEDYGGLYVAKFHNSDFRFVSAIQHPPEVYLQSDIFCSCDGLFLYKCHRIEDENEEKTYVLWNPSSRRYKKFQYPYILDDSNTHQTLYGICYNSLVKDYKVVIGDMKHYAIFSCKNNKWSKMKQMNPFWYSERLFSKGVSCNGSYYWILQNYEENVEFEMICFDWRDENLKKLPKPKFEGKSYYFELASLGGHLCLFVYDDWSQRNEMRIMKKIGHEDSWVEFKVQVQLQRQLPFHRAYTVCLVPICSINENEIVLVDNNEEIDNYILYDQARNTFTEIRKSTQTYNNPVLYLENLFVL